MATMDIMIINAMTDDAMMVGVMIVNEGTGGIAEVATVTADSRHVPAQPRATMTSPTISGC
jgi:hypothetical protein